MAALIEPPKPSYAFCMRFVKHYARQGKQAPACILKRLAELRWEEYNK